MKLEGWHCLDPNLLIFFLYVNGFVLTYAIYLQSYIPRLFKFILNSNLLCGL